MDTQSGMTTEDDPLVEQETLEPIKRADAEFDREEDRPFEEVAAELRRKYIDS